MWSQLLLTLTFLLVVNGRQVAPVECRPPHLAVGGQCLLVDTDTSEGCTAPFVVVGDQCIYFATFAELNYQEARQMCHSLDSELATVDTATRLKNIIDYINIYGLERDFFWVDGSDETVEGEWFTSSGLSVPMGTPFWRSWIGGRMPDNAYEGGEDCLHLYKPHYYFNDYGCSIETNFLCEQPHQLVANVSLPQPHLDCPAFYVGVGGRCLSFMTWADQTWVEARQSCHGLGGELAAVTDIEDLRAIYFYLHQEGIAGHSFWLGGSDAATEGVWTWTDGATVPSGAPYWGYVINHSGLEPDGGSDENCLLLYAEGFHYFRDASCGLLMNPLCQVLVQ